MRKATYTDRVSVVNGLICRIVTAHVYNKQINYELDIYREYEDGTAESRNLYYQTVAGYCVSVPGDKNSGYYGSLGMLEEYGQCRVMCLGTRAINSFELQEIEGKYSDFVKYVIPKTKRRLTVAETMHLLRVWLEHREVEYLIAFGYGDMTYNANYWKLKNKKPVIDFMRKNPNRNYSLKEIQCILAEGITHKEYSVYRSWCSKMGVNLSYKKYLYIRDKEDMLATYCDHLRLLRESRHDKKDRYWLYPSDLQARHNQLIEEAKAEKMFRLKEEMAGKMQKYLEVVGRWQGYAQNIDGYDIYVSQNLEEWIEQADTLHQCIIACHYDERVINGNGNYAIVFIRKHGVPVATVEVKEGKKIGQFYCDETARNIKPSAELENTFSKWLDSFDMEAA